MHVGQKSIALIDEVGQKSIALVEVGLNSK